VSTERLSPQRNGWIVLPILVLLTLTSIGLLVLTISRGRPISILFGLAILLFVFCFTGFFTMEHNQAVVLLCSENAMGHPKNPVSDGAARFTAGRKSRFAYEISSEIVDGAVGMVELAVARLQEKEVVDLDEEPKAAMVSNLMVVLCSHENARPIVNTGSLY
jgi:hypothetical protein